MMKEFVIRFKDIPITEAWRVQTLMNALLTQLSADGEEGRRADHVRHDGHREPRPAHARGAARGAENDARSDAALAVCLLVTVVRRVLQSAGLLADPMAGARRWAEVGGRNCD